jgi:hypothetical protein
MPDPTQPHKSLTSATDETLSVSGEGAIKKAYEARAAISGRQSGGVKIGRVKILSPDEVQFRADIAEAMVHFAKWGDDLKETNFDDFVTIDLDTGEYTVAASRGKSVAAFEEKFGLGRRRMTGHIGSTNP